MSIAMLERNVNKFLSGQISSKKFIKMTSFNQTTKNEAKKIINKSDKILRKNNIK
ncbi:hypothetical protein [Maledivibacter halophilus]|uniref:Uncharacterized protein n=1 Tax=Maledivibacter halophilus TaxID=36842 RepID=A0A1T5KYY4_9FIRM|nr:hypothetical protein [Maledivibacter halophilus]SKC68977.1 hypothetical protein SAMN02194393_02194 [Maledivibacter halophilus]